MKSIIKQRGFTLLELSIVLVIVAVIVVVIPLCYVVFHFIAKFW